MTRCERTAQYFWEGMPRPSWLCPLNRLLGFNRMKIGTKSAKDKLPNQKNPFPNNIQKIQHKKEDNTKDKEEKKLFSCNVDGWCGAIISDGNINKEQRIYLFIKNICTRKIAPRDKYSAWKKWKSFVCAKRRQNKVFLFI